MAKKKEIKAVVTIVAEYTIKPENYPNAKTVEEMIALDQQSLDDGSWMLEDVVSGCAIVSATIKKA